MTHTTTDAPRPALLWQFDVSRLVASTACVGGGIGLREWIVNAQVPLGYGRYDLVEHVEELGRALGCAGAGVGLLTAASLDQPGYADDGDVVACATVGISKPTWAADRDDAVSAWSPGTINVVVQLPVRLSEAALLNLLVTTTEAKTQALFERGVPGTGTASDAVCVVCTADGPAVDFAGPRSPWGSRAARAVHAAVLAGLG